MAYNKIVLKDQTLIDLTSDTVTPDTLAVGATAHDKTGASIVGTMPSGGGGASTKYGATSDTFLGDVDSNGVLQKPTAKTDLVFDGVTDIKYQGLQYLAYHLGSIMSASFPNMTHITNDYALNFAFDSSSIKSVSFPVLQSITGNQALNRAFYSCNALQSIEFPSLVSISGNKSLSSLCQSCIGALMIASFPALKEITSPNACNYIFSECSKLTTVSFPMLETITGNQCFYYGFNSCRNLENISFPKLKTIGDPTATSSNYGHFCQAFRNTTKITSLEFPELTAIYCTYSSASYSTFANKPILYSRTTNLYSGYSTIRLIIHHFSCLSIVNLLFFRVCICRLLYIWDSPQLRLLLSSQK